MAEIASRPGRHEPPPLARPPRPMPFPLNVYQTSVGRKWVMALTGIGLLGYVLVHMIGNLHIYEGPDQMFEYAEALRDLGGSLVPRSLLLWIMRLGLIAMFGLHIHAAFSLQERSRKASDSTGLVTAQKRYHGGQDYLAANYASRTMRWTGPIILLYLVFHLADLTWGWLSHGYVRGDPYHNLVDSMNALPIALIYLVANIALAIHIFHGTWSLFQSLGIINPRYNAARRALAGGLAAVILVGNLSFPILIQTGLINEDDRQCEIGDFACMGGETESAGAEN